MNWFAHKHIGQLKECAAWPKHEQQLRKHSRRKILNHDGNCLQKLLISLLFYVFLVLTVHPSFFPVLLSLTFSLPHSSPCLFTPHLCNKPQLSSPLNLFFPLSLHLIPALSSLPDLWLGAQWVTPLLKSSEMEGGEGRERKKPPGREQKQESMTEKNIENKNGRRES